MPTIGRAFAAVAEILAGVDPRDGEGVEAFYRRRFPQYPEPVRALISDFLVGTTGMPSAAALKSLRRAVSLPLEKIPAVEAPQWDTRYGLSMTDQTTDEEHPAVARG